MSCSSPVSSSRGFNVNVGDMAPVVQDGMAQLRQFHAAACNVENEDYAFLKVADANADTEAASGDLDATTSGNWLMDLFRKIFSLIADGRSNEKIRQELDTALSLQIEHCSLQTRTSLSRLRIIADTVAKNGAGTQDRDIRQGERDASTKPVSDLISDIIRQLRLNLDSLSAIQANLNTIVDTDTYWPLDASDVKWITGGFITLAERTNQLSSKALGVTASVGDILRSDIGSGHGIVAAGEV